MGLYLYGITSSPELPTAALGLGGVGQAEVSLLGNGGLRLVVSVLDRELEELQSADPKVTLAAVQRHDELLTAISRSAPVLPVRFGTVLADEAAAEHLVADRGGQLARALAAVAGAGEWVVRVDAVDALPASSTDEAADLTPGHAFFARKRSQTQARIDARAAAAAVGQALSERLHALSRASRQLPLREPDTVLRTAYLIDSREEERLLATVDACEGAAVTVQGPLPPYRFADQPSSS